MGRRTRRGPTGTPGSWRLYWWGYSAEWAQGGRKAAQRPRPVRLGEDGPLRPVVLDLLRQRWSPVQIAAWLALEFPDRPEMRVSHEPIYPARYRSPAATYGPN